MYANEAGQIQKLQDLRLQETSMVHVHRYVHSLLVLMWLKKRTTMQFQLRERVL